MASKLFDKLSNLRPRQLFLLAAAAGILIFVIMFFALNKFTKNRGAEIPITEVSQEQNVQRPAATMKEVVIAAKTIEAKTMILPSMVTTEQRAEDTLPGDVVTDVTEIVNKPARERIMKGDVISQQKVFRNMEQAGFVGSIPSDCRAVSVSVNDVTGVAGFAKPGDYVDVLLIEGDNGSVTSRMILQNVLLLSVNKNMGVDNTPKSITDTKSDEEVEAINPATVAIENPTLATLALRPDEVLKLVSAAKLGDICLMLRPLIPQGDFTTNAEYTIESMARQKSRKDEESQKEVERLKAQAEANKHIGSEVVASNTAPPDVRPEDRIAIMYGDNVDTEDVNEEKTKK